MGRKAKNKKEKKPTISITLDVEQLNSLNDCDVNKSKLINWLLLNYFNIEGGQK